MKSARVRVIPLVFLLLASGACLPPGKTDDGGSPKDGDTKVVKDSGADCSKEMACEDSKEFCFYEMSANCGDGGERGRCIHAPDAVIEIYAPVCGCDGKTYSSEPAAKAMGMSARSEGECS